MERKVTEELRKWRSDPDRKPLIVTGCRQVGKTYSVKAFAESEYRSCIYIDFEKDPDKREIFRESRDADHIRRSISMASDVPLYDGESVVIFDEVHLCPEACSALKQLAEDRRTDFIAISSFFWVETEMECDCLSPMGYVSFLRMHPMDFEEYLWAMGVNKDLIKTVKESVQRLEPVNDYFHTIVSRHFRRYLVVGGMPEAVSIYASTGDYVRAAGALDRIIASIAEDAGRHSLKAGRKKIPACLRSISEQLSREDKRFRFADVEGIEASGMRMYGNALNWLEGTGLVLKSGNVSEPSCPLSGRACGGLFKLYMVDTGVLMRMMKGADPSKVAVNDPFAYHGALMENAVASALAKKGYDLFFYAKRNSTLEIDFAVSMGGKACLIDLKPARNGRSRALNTVLAEGDEGRIGFKVMDSNVETDSHGAVCIPLYAASFFEDPLEPELPPALSADEMNEMFRQLDRTPRSALHTRHGAGCPCLPSRRPWRRHRRPLPCSSAPGRRGTWHSSRPASCLPRLL